jgi:hypothetical protein
VLIFTLFRTSKILKYLSNFELSTEQIYACILAGFFITLHWISCLFYTIGILQVEGNLVTRKFPWIIENDLCPTQVGTAEASMSPFTSNSAAIFSKHGMLYDPDDDWFTGLRGVNSTFLCSGVPKSVSDRYLTSLYWSVVTMATVGYGDFTASTNIEYAFIIGIAVIGTLLSAAVMGFISSQIAFDSANTKNADVGLLSIRGKLLASCLDSTFKEKCLENVHSMMEYMIPEQLHVLNVFPNFFHETLLHSLFLPYINTRAIFAPLDVLTKETMCLKCKTYLCSPDEIILSTGSTDCSLYVLMHGEVQILGEVQDGTDDVLYEHLRTDGDVTYAYFGEQVACCCSHIAYTHFISRNTQFRQRCWEHGARIKLWRPAAVLFCASVEWN